MKRSERLVVMYWYNMVVTGGFALLIAAMYLFPDLAAVLQWPREVNPIVISMVVPLFAVMAVFAGMALSRPESAELLLKMQIAYKPFAIVFLLIFTVNGYIHPLWSAVIIAGLLLYIVGNIWALRGTHRE
ncbi:MAG: hypothetical protein JXB03_03640 [Spirochaetales bacterium]|nr:hypothetical protein [Spirochaetales bacterium]